MPGRIDLSRPLLLKEKGYDAFGHALDITSADKVTEAFNDMKKNCPINDNQVYVNLVVNFKHSIMAFGIFREIKCTISADVVEFK